MTRRGVGQTLEFTRNAYQRVGKWANEDLIDRDTADTFQLPSDIKPGVYILRSELLALHGNSRTYMPSEGSGPQFYIHCFNLDISGDGKEVPKGVKFPGGYKRDDPGVKFNLYRGGQADRDNYVSIRSGSPNL